jgi:hypothetical protein
MTEETFGRRKAPARIVHALWFPVTRKPKKPGQYLVALAAQTAGGGMQAEWDGVRWKPIAGLPANVAISSKHLVWRGDGADALQPFTR